MLDELKIARAAIDYAQSSRFSVVPEIDQDPVGWIIGRDLSSLSFDDYFNPEFDRAVETLPQHPANPHGFPIPERQGQAIALHWSQAGPLYAALQRDDIGHFRYSTIVWSSIKKSAKSTIAAAIGLWMMFRKPYATGKVIANDLKQAESRVYYYMRRGIDLHPEWKHLVTVNRSEMTFPEGSKIEAIPIDPAGEAGGNDDIVIYSEIWAWKHTKAQQMWTESTLSPLKYGESFRWCETYAGFTGESPVLEQLYEQGVKQGRKIGDEMYANEAARLFVLWRTKPYLPWQTPEYRAQEAATLTATEYLRVHENRWSTSTSTFVPIEWWDACQVPDLPPLETMQACVLAVDAAVTNDSFGLLMVSRKDGIVQVRYARRWMPPEGGEIDFSEPEKEIIRLCREYPIVEVAYDEHQLADMAQRLRRKHGINMRKFSQGRDRAVADKKLHDRIRDRGIVHGGEPELREHIQNAHKKEEGDAERLRIIKRTDKAKIDLAVCLSMATDRAMYLGIE